MNTILVRKNGNLSYRDTQYSPPDSMWADCPKLEALQDPFLATWVKEDFLSYTAADWAVTEIDAAGTQALTDVAGGGLLLTCANTEDDSVEMQKVGEAYQLVAGKPLWFESMLQVSEATEIDFIIGLCITDTTAIPGVSDGVYFLKVDAATAITYHCEKDGNDTTGNAGVAIVAATDTRFGIKFDGKGTVEYWIDGHRVAHSGVYIPDDELLTVTCGVSAGDGNARTLTWKYYEVFQIL